MTTLTSKQKLTTVAVLCVSAMLLALAPASAQQQQIGVDIYSSQAAATVRLAFPKPELGTGVIATAADTRFTRILTNDLMYAEIFAFVPLPPNQKIDTAAAKKAGAQALLHTRVDLSGSDFVVEARLIDVTSGTTHMARRYRGNDVALTRIAHTLANDLVLFFNGKPGVFLTQIAFVSTRDGSKELYVMDYDGSNQRRVTTHRSITLSPSWSPDGESLAYTSFNRGTSDLYIINRRGGGRMRLTTNVNLNTAPSFSPDGREIAFVGSIAGNPDIYIIGTDGKGMRRLTSGNSIESTPAWSPTGRQIAFTSSRNGTPQIYVMDAEGSNVRRVSFDGNWNDDASWSPSGDLLAYTSWVNGRFQIRIMNLVTQESTVLAGEGSNEQPSWSPDGKSIIFASNRSGGWQIYRIGIDGRGLTRLTSTGENNAPRWSAVSH
jgi:TolB protein